VQRRAITMAAKQTLKPNFYSIELNRTQFTVPNRYQKLCPVGQGAYGQVWFVIPNTVCLHKRNICIQHL